MSYSSLTNLIPQLVPEMAGREPYVLRKPSHFPELPNTGAFAMRVVDYTTREQLLADGSWRGQEPLIAICLDTWEDDDLLGTFAHELAHVQPLQPQRDDVDPCPAITKLQLMFLQSKNHERPFEELSLPPWHQHGLWFVRTALHLHHRLWKLGHEVGLRAMSIGGPITD